MGRRRGYGSVLNAIARDTARVAREIERDARRRAREEAAAARAYERELKHEAKLAKQAHLEMRAEEVEEINQSLEDLIDELQHILEHTLDVDDCIDFESLRLSDKYDDFQEEEFLMDIPLTPNFWQRLIPGWQKRFDSEIEIYNSNREKFEARMERLRQEFEHRKNLFLEKVNSRNSDVDELKEAYLQLEVDAVIAYNQMVLERSEYPDGFPQQFRLAYVPESKELVVDYELPTIDVVPADAEARYVKSKDEIVTKPRKAKEIKDLYQDIVAAVAIRTIHEIFEADQADGIEVVAFNGFVSTRDKSTGKKVQPYLVSVRSTKSVFCDFDLEHIEKAACLRNLGANVSSRPDELVPVKPLVEFNTVDKRFIEETDVISELDSRPNLMELTPSEFETLVSNLFGKLGLESKLTRSSRDGGVDCVAFDCRPVLGGKVVIQAKRYRHTVGVSAVRDLYGTMQHEGANKGILVTTSGYGPDAFEFSQDKPIELITGGQLLYLLEQVGVQARIVFPEEQS